MRHVKFLAFLIIMFFVAFLSVYSEENSKEKKDINGKSEFELETITQGKRKHKEAVFRKNNKISKKIFIEGYRESFVDVKSVDQNKIKNKKKIIGATKLYKLDVAIPRKDKSFFCVEEIHTVYKDENTNENDLLVSEQVLHIYNYDGDELFSLKANDSCVLKSTGGSASGKYVLVVEKCFGKQVQRNIYDLKGNIIYSVFEKFGIFFLNDDKYLLYLDNNSSAELGFVLYDLDSKVLVGKYLLKKDKRNEYAENDMKFENGKLYIAEFINKNSSTKEYTEVTKR